MGYRYLFIKFWAAIVLGGMCILASFVIALTNARGHVTGPPDAGMYGIAGMVFVSLAGVSLSAGRDLKRHEERIQRLEQELARRT